MRRRVSTEPGRPRFQSWAEISLTGARSLQLRTFSRLSADSSWARRCPSAPNGGVHFRVGIALLAADYEELRERRAVEAGARPRVIA